MKLASPDAPRTALAQLAEARATGTLHVGGDPPGTLQLTDGAVTFAASPRTPGVGDLLTTGGRLPHRVWDSAVAVGAPDHRVGAVLIEDGHLTQGELELCVLGVIFDAGYFVLGTAPVPLRFEADRPHWLGSAARIPATTLLAEADRRRGLLAALPADPAVDRLPVVPVPRVPRERIQLSGLGWELLVQADGRRTVAALARLLGRSGYACLLEVRRLAADGLVRAAEPPQAGGMPPGDAATTAELPGAPGGHVRGAAASGAPGEAPAPRVMAGSAVVPAPRLAAARPATGRPPTLGTTRAGPPTPGTTQAGPPTPGTTQARPTTPGTHAGPTTFSTTQARPATPDTTEARSATAATAVAPPALAVATVDPPGPGARVRTGGTDLPRRKPALPEPDGVATPAPAADPALLRRLRTALRRMT